MRSAARCRLPDRWCPGAGSNHRHCDFQSHALPTELPGHCGSQSTPERAVYSKVGPPCPPRFAFGFAWRSHADEDEACPVWPEGRRRANHTLIASKTTEISPIRRPHRPWACREWHRNPTASGSDRRLGSARNKTALTPRSRACRRSGTAWRMARFGAGRPDLAA